MNNTLVILLTKILVWQRGHFGYSEEFDDFSSLYWIPNLHKNPHRERYTADTSTFSTHELFINLDNVLSAVKGGLHSHCHSLYSQEYDDLLYIEYQNFTIIHIEKSTCSTEELSINMTNSLSAVTGGLQSYCDKVYWHNSFNQMWILRYCKDILDHFILVRYRQFHLSKHFTFLLLANHSLWKSINTLKEIIYNAFIFTMVSNLFRSSLQVFFVMN